MGQQRYFNDFRCFNYINDARASIRRRLRLLV
jgi:hypothetical protein